jgi:hypothetical protein
MSRSSTLHGALAICVFLFIGLGLALARPGLTDYAPYLSFSPDKDGAKAFRLLLELEGAKVKEWRLAPEQLPGGTGQLFLAIEPFGVTHESSMEWVRWAEQGNEVVVFGSYPSLIEDWKSIATDSEEADGRVTATQKDGVSVVLEAEAGTDIRLELLTNEEERLPEVRLRDKAGVLAVRQAVGEGHITISVTGDWLMNEHVLEGDRFEALWLLLDGESLAGRTVYFDEYHHGYSVSPGITQVYPMWLLAALGQAALGALAWLWWRGKRFGPAYTPRTFRVRRGDETLLAVAGWYRRGRLTFEALDQSVERLRRSLQTRGGVPAGAGAGQLFEATVRVLECRQPVASSSAPLRGVLEKWEMLKRDSVNGLRIVYRDKEWLEDSAVLGEVLKTLEEEV